MKKEVSIEASPRSQSRGNTDLHQRWRQPEAPTNKQRRRSREDEGRGQELRVLAWKSEQPGERQGYS